MNLILALISFLSGLLMVWQWAGLHKMADWCNRLVIKAVDSNAFCKVVGLVLSKYGLIMGLIALGVEFLLVADKDALKEGMKNRGSYVTILVFEVIFALGTLL